MKRTLLPLELSTMKVRMRQNEPLQDFESDFISVCEYVLTLEKQNRKLNFEKAKKIVYLDSLDYIKEQGILYLRLKSARYAKSREVINTDTLESRGVLKKDIDGDEEKTHLTIRFENDNTAVCIFEKNIDGIGVGLLFDYLNKFIIRCHSSKKDNIYYEIVHANIVSQEFLAALEGVKRIKGVTLTVEQKDLNVSEAKSFSGRDDLSQDVDLYFRPSAKGKSITGDTVKEFYKLYNSKKRKVKRITVKADDKQEAEIVFDTEKVKEKLVVEIEETVTGEVHEESIKKQLVNLVQKY